MKKKLFKTRLLSFATFCGLALAFASCANEDVAQSTTGTDNENDKNLTTFVAGDEAKTRTSMDYSSGAFFWEAGDKIYVKDDDGIWQVSNNAPSAKVAFFKFKVPGKFKNSTTYKVYYPGKNGSNDQVTIPAAQTQATPNSTDHFGVSGDCGTADASKQSNGSFAFLLDHQAAILVFQPYITNTVLSDCYVTKIEVTSDNDITDTYTLNSTTGELTGTGTGKMITLTTQGTGSYANGFPLTNSSASLTTNGAYMLIRPGSHTLTVSYTVKDVVTNVEGTITKTLSSFNYAKNTYYDMTANLNMRNDPGLYYQWDAQENTWFQHEWNAPALTDRWQVTLNGQTNSNINLLTKAVCPQRWANMSFPGANIRNDAVNSCKDCPNANEAVWYAQYGDPRWDNQTIWTAMGHLHKGGIWLKKKARIASDNGKSITDLANAAPDGTDYRVNSGAAGPIYTNNVVSSVLPSETEIGDYFYLPATGLLISTIGTMVSLETEGYYWTSTANSGGVSIQTDIAFAFQIFQNKIKVTNNLSREMNSINVKAFE